LKWFYWRLALGCCRQWRQ